MAKDKEPAVVPFQRIENGAMVFADGSVPVPTWAKVDTSREPFAIYFVDAADRPVSVRSITVTPGEEREQSVGQLRRLAETRAELALGGDHLRPSRDPKFKADRDALAEQYLKEV